MLVNIYFRKYITVMHVLKMFVTAVCFIFFSVHLYVHNTHKKNEIIEYIIQMNEPKSEGGNVFNR